MGYSGIRDLLWAAAVIPPVLLMIYIYRQDKIEKEPPGLLFRLFCGGALSVLSAIVLESVGMAVGKLLFGERTVAYTVFTCFLVVGGAEEGGKFFFLRRITWRNPEFNYRFDAIVYAVFVSMGFALVENITYVLGDGTVATALLRGTTAIPGHAAFAVFMGYYYGMAKLYEDYAWRCGDGSLAARYRYLSQRYLRSAVIVPALIHGFYDFCLEMQLAVTSWIFVGFIVLLDLVALRRIRKIQRSDSMV